MAVCTVCGNPTTNKCGKCSNAWYCKTECQRSEWKDHKKVCNYPFEIKESEGKGLGLFATRDLQIGDLVVCEDPILYFECGKTEDVLISHRTFKEAYEKLGRGKRNKILALAGASLEAAMSDASLALELRTDLPSEDQEWKKALGAFSRNCSSVNQEGKRIGSGLYISNSRINHSCSPNTESSYLEDKRTSKERRAIRNIRKGEELLGDYMTDGESFLIRSERREQLMKTWKFHCECSLCSSDHEENDALRQRVKKLYDVIPIFQAREDIQGAANAALERCTIIEKCDDMKRYLPGAYLELYNILLVAAMQKSYFGFDDALIAGLVKQREHYREKAYELFKRTKLTTRKDYYNKMMKQLAMMGYLGAVSSNKLMS